MIQFLSFLFVFYFWVNKLIIVTEETESEHSASMYWAPIYVLGSELEFSGVQTVINTPLKESLV